MVGGMNPVIAHTYTDPNAPTGEGTVYVDSNGRHWRGVATLPMRGTGDRQAVLRDGKVHEE